MKKAFTTALLASSVAFAGQALSYEAGDMIVRVGAVNVQPMSEGGDISGALGPNIDIRVEDDMQLGITGTYMLTDNVGIGVLAATPFSHDISIHGTVIGDTKHLPPTVSAQYYFNNQSNFTPYVGIGINYTNFFEEELNGTGKAATGTTELELDDSWGVALEAGVDWDIDEKWLVSAQVWYMNLNTDATLRAGGADALSFNVELDPWVYMVGVGYKF